MTAREAAERAEDETSAGERLAWATLAMALAYIENGEVTKPFTEKSLQMMDRQLVLSESISKETAK